VSDNLIEEDFPRRFYVTRYIGTTVDETAIGGRWYQITYHSVGLTSGDLALPRIDAIRLATAILEDCGLDVEQHCRVCACTDDNACLEDEEAMTSMPCHWVERDLCSACAGK
jgi:hypothetical protein